MKASHAKTGTITTQAITTHAMTVALLSAVLSVSAYAGERQDAIVGAIIGGGAGAYLGHKINGQSGAIAGSAIGAMVGSAVATSDSQNARSSDYSTSYTYNGTSYPDVRTTVYSSVSYPVRQTVVVRKPVHVQKVIVVRDYHPRSYGKRADWNRSWAYESYGHNQRGYGYRR